MTRLWPQKFGSQLALITSLLLSLSVVAYGIVIATSQSGLVARLIQRQSVAHAQDIASDAVRYLIVNDFISLEKHLVKTARLTELRRIEVMDERGQIISAVEKRADHTVVPRFTQQAFAVPKSPTQTSNTVANTLVTWSPFELEGATAWVRLETSLDTIQATRYRVVTGALAIGLITVLVGLLVLHRFLQPRLRAIRDVVNFAERLDEQLGKQMPVDRHSLETQRLATTLNDTSTRLRLADQALRQSEQRLRTIVENMPVMMHAFDQQGNIVSWNRECERVTGYSAEEIVGNPDSMKLLYPDDAYRAEKLAEWRRTGDHHNWEWLLTAKDGAQHSILWSSISDRFPIQGWDSWGIGIDITEQKGAQRQARERYDQLAHALRVATMGELATGLAHEINQPLSAILNYVRGAQRRLASQSMDTAEYQELLRHIQSQAERSAEIVRRLREYVRKDSSRHVATDVNEVARLSVDFLAHELVRDDVRVRLLTQVDLPQVQADPIQLEQVFVNLALNAIDAMVEASTETRTIDFETRLEGHFIVVTVRDSGPGLSETMRHQALLPFITSKKGGLGLGLAISSSIIDAHGGRLWVKPRGISGGAEFSFTLPLEAREVV